jgi:hypothetical protein
VLVQKISFPHHAIYDAINDLKQIVKTYLPKLSKTKNHDKNLFYGMLRFAGFFYSAISCRLHAKPRAGD